MVAARAVIAVLRRPDGVPDLACSQCPEPLQQLFDQIQARRFPLVARPRRLEIASEPKDRKKTFASSSPPTIVQDYAIACEQASHSSRSMSFTRMSSRTSRHRRSRYSNAYRVGMSWAYSESGAADHRRTKVWGEVTAWSRSGPTEIWLTRANRPASVCSRCRRPGVSSAVIRSLDGALGNRALVPSDWM